MGALSPGSIVALLGVLPTLAVGGAALLLVVWLLATPLADILIRQRARRLPLALAERFSEEWAAESQAIENRLRKVLFALGLSVTPTRSFVEAVGGPGAVAGNLVVLFDVRVYSTFGLRLLALIVDLVVTACLSVLLMLMLRAVWPRIVTERYAAGSVLLGFAVSVLLLLTIQVFLVVRFGGSPGKLLMKMRVVPMRGASLTFRHAALRVSPDFVLQLWYLAGTLIVIGSIDLEALRALSDTRQSALFAQQLGALWWMSLLPLAAGMWGLADVCTYYVSNEGRALHDFLAGTVVVLKGPDVVTTADIIAQPRRGILR